MSQRAKKTSMNSDANRHWGTSFIFEDVGVDLHQFSNMLVGQRREQSAVRSCCGLFDASCWGVTSGKD